MRALTIRQPWAGLIAHGVKHLETRSWRTHYRGPVAIHAALDMRDFWRIWDHARVVGALGRLDLDDDILTRGAVVAVANLADCLPIGQCHEPDHEEVPAPSAAVRWSGDQAWTVWSSRTARNVQRRLAVDISDELPLGDFAPGRWAWLLNDVQPLTRPVPAKGRQGLWRPDWALQDQFEAST